MPTDPTDTFEDLVSALEAQAFAEGTSFILARQTGAAMQTAVRPDHRAANERLQHLGFCPGPRRPKAVCEDNGSATVALPNGRQALIDLQDAPTVGALNWCARISPRKTPYVVTNVRRPDGSTALLSLHRFILGLEWDGPTVVDHIDGDGLNNRRVNLRVATGSENLCNRGRQKNNTSGYKGVTFDRARGLWTAQIAVEGKNKFLGRFMLVGDAAAAYDAAAIRYHGAFARTNMMSGA